MRRSILALSGFAGSGKDTIATQLVKKHGFKRLSFAQPLKDCVASITGWDREKLEGLSLEDRKWRETRDDWWSERLGREITPRLFLTTLGTDIIRKEIPDIWLLSLERHLSLEPSKKIVITDCRFNNEINVMVRKMNAKHIRVMRKNEPDWSKDKYPSPPLYTHQSEYEWLVDITGQTRRFDYNYKNIWGKETPEFERSIERMINEL